MMIAFLAAATAAAATPKATPIDPGSWFKENDYPFEAMKNGAQGSVVFEVQVDANGNPTDCQVTKSSGNALLDQATCSVVRSRARFKPATDADGKPVVGLYSTTTVWKLGGAETYYRAVIIDYSTTADHPSCRIDANAAGPVELTCERALQQLPQWVSRRYSKLVMLYAAGPLGARLFQGEQAWGARISYLVNELYFLNAQPPPICMTVVAEGLAAGRDACGNSPGRHVISDKERKASTGSRFESSIFGIESPSAARPRGHSSICKDGESVGEASACK